jgi:hypothetical protein
MLPPMWLVGTSSSIPELRSRHFIETLDTDIDHFTEHVTARCSPN